MDVAQVRRFPYPYKAMVAICSDLDGTPDRDHYLNIVRFLNTEEDTPAGKGVGLEVGNTIYFDMPDSQFAYWNTDDAGREVVRKLIRSRHIDCFHSFGDLATTREHAKRALTELEEHGCRMECWVDHAVAATNFGADIMRGSGDLQGLPAYHADLTHRHGVRFVWRGRVTSVVGQDCARSINHLVSFRNPVSSARTAAKEMIKGILGRSGNAKFAMHGRNDLARRAQLRDGRTVYEFMRCNPHFGGVAAGDTADGFGDVLTDTLLQRIIQRGGTSILYTHLGKTREPGTVFSLKTIKALHNLADAADRGEILVTTTRRLLGFWLARKSVAVTKSREQHEEMVNIDTSSLRKSDMPCDLDGLTVYVENSKNARLFVDGSEIANAQRHPADEQGRESISVPWLPLRFPDW
jgi:hypothetical protein